MRMVIKIKVSSLSTYAVEVERTSLEMGDLEGTVQISLVQLKPTTRKS